MILASDNWAGASEKITSAIANVAAGPAPAYGDDDLTKSVERRFRELFERDVAVYFVATGTAANGLGISSFARPGGIVLCHKDSHIVSDEAGSVSYLGGGLITRTLEGDGGKIVPDDLASTLTYYCEEAVHIGQPVVLSLSQLTEWGRAYQPAEISELSALARDRGLAVHMDGARFAVATAATGRSPADLTWKSGVDVMSFGGTKNGCLVAEAVVFFDPEKASDFEYSRLRAGHGMSKNWVVAAQFDAYLEEGHWLDLAGQANAAGARIAAAVEASDGSSLALRRDANEVFAWLTSAQAQRLKEAGVQFHRWRGKSAAPKAGSDGVLARLVTSFQTSEDELELFARALNGD